MKRKLTYLLAIASLVTCSAVYASDIYCPQQLSVQAANTVPVGGRCTATYQGGNGNVVPEKGITKLMISPEQRNCGKVTGTYVFFAAVSNQGTISCEYQPKVQVFQSSLVLDSTHQLAPDTLAKGNQWSSQGCESKLSSACPIKQASS